MVKDNGATHAQYVTICRQIAFMTPSVHNRRQCVFKSSVCVCSPANGVFQVDGLWLDVVWRRALAHPSPAV